MINAILTAIINLIITLVNVILAPIDALIFSLLPVVKDFKNPEHDEIEVLDL